MSSEVAGKESAGFSLGSEAASLSDSVGNDGDDTCADVNAFADGTEASSCV